MQMQSVPEIPLDWVYTVRIPGLPAGGRMVMGDAEANGVWQPEYSAAEISRIFLTRTNDRFLSRKLASTQYPDLGSDTYFTPLWSDTDDSFRRFGPSGQRWTLGEVERIIVHLYICKQITYTQYTIGRQIVAWTARGFGCFHG